MAVLTTSICAKNKGEVLARERLMCVLAAKQQVVHHYVWLLIQGKSWHLEDVFATGQHFVARQMWKQHETSEQCVQAREMRSY